MRVCKHFSVLFTLHLVAIWDPNLHNLCKMLATNGKSVIEHGLLIFNIYLTNIIIYYNVQTQNLCQVCSDFSACELINVPCM